jgi:alkanesulfonate monooxygenase SsuD/methylene tetrahydromethanopterin reductase-like flavin-dependent oxidoreductase (luciferase family)
LTDYGQPLHFGTFVTPSAARADQILELAVLTEVLGLDFVTIQDHPYQARFLDTWTLLSAIAAQTSTVRVAPNVINLPLRPPLVLARSVASLDLLSNGRVELGLGAGAFWDAIVAAGGPRRSPGQSVAALEEALDIIRAAWDVGGGSLRHEGRHYQVKGVHPGPAPAHPIEIWLGAYGKRMLALTGARADGWIPTMGYADPDALPAMNAAIDDAAVAANRSPADVRRLYNVNGRFGGGDGLLSGSPAEWAQRLADLTLDQGMSTYLLAVDDADTLRRFAAEVVPAVRELVDAGRSSGAAAPRADLTPERVVPSAGRSITVTPTVDDGVRRSAEQPWPEADRPVGPHPDPEARYTPEQQATGQHLIDVHDALRAELARLLETIEQVERGTLDAGRARSLINTMTVRQNTWTLGAFCESYCRIVTGHHGLEDASVFPHLRRRDPRLAGVLDRLEEEHHVIAALLDRVDRALVALVTEPDGMAQLQAAVDLLSDAMTSHLAYEERQLVEPLARLGFY